MIDPPIAYRDATPADGLLLDAMARKVWLETFGRSAPASDIALYLEKAYGPKGALIRSLSDPDQHVRIACADAAMIGYVKLSPRWLDDSAILPGALQLSQLYVAADWHGRGVAQALIDWTIAEARRRAATALVLTVWEENFRALRFYVRNGFVHIGDYAFPTGTQIDRDLIMQLAL
jgi:ribosomal protein S18 acetylase RimI-like enzyme